MVTGVSQSTDLLQSRGTAMSGASQIVNHPRLLDLVFLVSRTFLTLADRGARMFLVPHVLDAAEPLGPVFTGASRVTDLSGPCGTDLAGTSRASWTQSLGSGPLGPGWFQVVVNRMVWVLGLSWMDLSGGYGGSGVCLLRVRWLRSGSCWGEFSADPDVCPSDGAGGFCILLRV